MARPAAGERAPARAACRRCGPAHSIVWPIVVGSSRQRTIALRHVVDPDRLEARVGAGQRHTGKTACSRANRFRKRSRVAEDHRRPQDRQVERRRRAAPPRRAPSSAGSGSARRRAAPSALTWTTRRTPARRAGRGEARAAGWTWTRSNSASLPCRMRDQVDHRVACRAAAAPASASSWTSPPTTSTVGSSWRWRARGGRRVGDADRGRRRRRALDQLFADAAADEAGAAEDEDVEHVGRGERRRWRRRFSPSAGGRQGRSLSGGGAFGSGGPIVAAQARASASAPGRPAARRSTAALREHLLDVVARLGERDVLGPDRGSSTGPSRHLRGRPGPAL